MNEWSIKWLLKNADDLGLKVGYAKLKELK